MHIHIYISVYIYMCMCIAIVCFVSITRELCQNILSMFLTLNYQIRISLPRVNTVGYK